jgi:hypothetical protein
MLKSGRGKRALTVEDERIRKNKTKEQREESNLIQLPNLTTVLRECDISSFPLDCLGISPEIFGNPEKVLLNPENLVRLWDELYNSYNPFNKELDPVD